MTKTTTQAAPVEAQIDVRPDAITIIDRNEVAFSAAMALIRTGWEISHRYPPKYFEHSGQTTIMLVRSKPTLEVNTLAIEIANKAEALAAEKHLRAYERDVALAAEKIITDAKKAAAQAELAAKIESQRQALAALEAAAAATA